MGTMRITALCLLLLLLPWPTLGDDRPDDREAMVEEIRRYALLSGDRPFADSVMASMGKVQRHSLIPSDQQRFAYENRPLPIGYGQTISQPYIVALMTDLVQPDADDLVLEIGTGSGYQAAVLAEIVDKVYSIEIIEPLADRARRQLGDLGYTNVVPKLGDGYYGWKQHAPFDAIVVTAGGPSVPAALLDQLADGGRIVMPVESGDGGQDLLRLRRRGDDVVTENLGAVRFVPLIGEQGWN